MKQKLVGIVMDLYDESDLIWSFGLKQPLIGTHQNLFDALGEVGCLPVGLSAPACGTAVKAALKPLAGVLIPGGPTDVFPGSYGGRLTRHNGRISPEKDAIDLAYMKLALEMGKPVMGIGRGMQLLNVFLGGSMLPDVGAASPTALLHQNAVAPAWLATHRVRVQRGTRLGKAMPEETYGVNSFHHQCPGELAPGLVLSAVSEDGFIEAYEGAERPVIGVQWRPELMFRRSPEQLAPFRLFAEMMEIG